MQEDLRREVRCLTTRLGVIVQEQCGRKVFAAIEELRNLSKQMRQRPELNLVRAADRAVNRLSVKDAASVAHAFSLFFHLVNLCEERERIRRLEAYERQDAGAPMSVRRTLKELRRRRVPSPGVERLLDSMDVEPVLTAHPTEAKRRSVFNHILRIGQTLESASELTGAALDEQVDPWIEALWLTDEVRERPVTPGIEIENTLIYFERSIYGLAGAFWERFRRELKSAYPRLPQPRPFFRFGSWVGTDRDGNPNVTREASLRAAEEHRQSILRYYLRVCQRLLSIISFPCPKVDRCRDLERDLESVMRRFPATQVFCETDQPGELYRRKLRAMSWRLERTAGRAEGAYDCAEEFIRDARLLEQTLEQNSSPRVAALGPGTLRVTAEVFGFHSASHDFRQHAALTRAAAEDLLREANLPAQPAAARIGSIRSLMRAESMPMAHTDAAQKVLQEFQTLKEIQSCHGEIAAHRYILSMSMSAADLWDVLLLGRAAGLIERDAAASLRSSFDVVPLFETYGDLIACHEIIDQLLSDGVYRRVIQSRGNFQEVMLGYSDSVKDSGYLAANWSLFLAQERLNRVAERHGVKLGLFHGKGGTIDRGGGMSYRSVQAQPHAAPGGRLRITEQGEVISFKYSNPAIALRNLEQLVSSVLDANLLHPRRVPAAKSTEWYECAQEMAESSRQFYRALVYETPEFPQYFFQATPVDLIDQLRLGSRPSRRFRSRELENLRAIPWVFAWTQSRHFLPSWYGVGHAIDVLVHDRAPRGLDLLKEMYREWPFFSVLVDNA
ncbi:MAG: phosphoenolpyruvate carboxylase, partial [Terriglobia bacterium]